MRPPGVGKAEHARNFIERLARGVVPCAAEDFELGRGLRIEDGGMTAARKQGNERRLERRILEVGRREVTADVVDADERDPQPVGKALGEGEPDEERPQKSRSIGDGDGGELLFLYVRHAKSTRDDFVDRIGMRTRGDLGHDAAVLRLHLCRGDNLIG